MKVFLTSAYPYHPQKNFAVKWLRESSLLDPFQIHCLANDPEEADIILFVEHHPGHDPYFFKVVKNSIYRQFQDKCFLYHDCDWVIPIIPGVYPSLERRMYNPATTRSGHYIARLCENEAIRFAGGQEKKYLFSFLGASKTHLCRKQIFELPHHANYLKDTSGKNSWKLNYEEKKNFEEEYVNIGLQSLFILCPRGIGPCTYRLFEAMEMGVVPVIISDEWLPIEGPVWEDFSLRIGENEIEKIPVILEKNRHKALQMGMRARKAWETWFSKEVSFHHLIEACGRIQEVRIRFRMLERLRTYREFLAPFHMRNLLRYTKNQMMN